MWLMLGLTTLSSVLIAQNFLSKNQTSSAGTPALQTVSCDPKKVAQPIGPYNLGKIVNDSGGKWLYTSGNIGINTEGKVVSQDVAEQAAQSLNNMCVVAETAGFDVNTDCVKTHIYLTEMGDFGKINKECEKIFIGKDTPPRVCIAAH